MKKVDDVNEIVKIVEYINYSCVLILVNGMIEKMSRDFDTKTVYISQIFGKGTLRIDIKDLRCKTE